LTFGQKGKQKFAKGGKQTFELKSNLVKLSRAAREEAALN